MDGEGEELEGVGGIWREGRDREFRRGRGSSGGGGIGRERGGV